MVIAALHGESFGAHGWDETAVSGVLALHGSFGHLLLHDHEPAGFAIGRVAADECEILTLGVRPAKRRLGFGRRLLGAVLQQAAAAACRMVHLEVSEANTAARGFYESQGFQHSGTRPGYYATAQGAPATAFLLSRRLF